MATQFERFISTMKKVLMLDQADLDFGIYRIMNQNRNEIERYLNNNLKTEVASAISMNASGTTNALNQQLKTAIEQANSLGVDPDTLPKVQQLRQQIAENGSSEDMENEVYSHLTIFFSRYYDGGDFISQRRYKKDVYAIPYEGEEVKLHWANADQYYIKTGEFFRNYRFALGNEKFCEFTLKEASVEQNNNLAQSNMERRFAICEGNPFDIKGNTLHINFTYDLMPKATIQKQLLEETFNIIKGQIPTDFATELLALRPTESDRNRTLLQKHLNDYVARNTFDYFIHKDLNGFLTRELDFYIKNEILMIDDINARSTDEFVAHLTVIKAIKTVGTKIIKFLASLENYQKRLWLKKKFVVQCDYCITLDRVPESLYPEICANDAQREKWISYFAIDEIDGFMGTDGYSVPLTVDFLKNNPFLVLDTQFFDIEFRHKLLASIDYLDEQCDGILINSENFQALRLLQEKYSERVKCIYIDPPYNTDATKIAYKNGYEHSSWLSLMESRLSIAKQYLMNTGVIEAAIDDYEFRYLNCCMENVFGVNNFISNIAIHTNPKGRDQGFVAQSHDYSILYAKNKIFAETYNFTLSAEALAKKYSKTNGEDAIRELPLKRTGTGKFREERPYMYFPFIYDSKNNKLFVVPEEEYKEIYNINTKEFNDLYLEELEEKYRLQGMDFILPIASDETKLRWRWGYKSCIEGCNNGILFAKKQKNSYAVYQSDIADEEVTPKSMWIGERYDASSKGTNLLSAMIPKNPFDYPKSLFTVEDNLVIGSSESDIVMDFFAGSGTTGHACIDLSRNNPNICRKYILVEMGNYFDEATRARIEKAIYSKEWKSGKPVFRDGISHCFKYIRLEQYEDTLNNLVLQPSDIDSTNADFYGGYMLGYLLDTETRDSLFNLQWFRNPWNMKLQITRQNELKEETIDMVETFNYLIGLNVKSINYYKEGICTVEGTIRDGEKTLVIWRDCDSIDNLALNKFFEKMAYSTRDAEFNRIYVNGDNNLENLRTEEEQWKVVLIEEEFSKRMFEDC